MNWRHAALLCLALVAFALDGCNTGQGILEGKTSTRVRVMNALSDGGALDVTTDTGTVVSGLGFQGISSYQDVQPGTRAFKVSANGGSTSLIDATNSLTPGVDYTFVIFGSVSGANGLIFSDAFTRPNGGTFKLRIVNAANGPGALDVYLTAAGVDLAATSPTIAGTAYGTALGFADAASGSYEIRITPAGSKDVIYDTGVRDFGDKTAVSLVIYNKGSNQLVNAAVLNVDDTGTGSVADNLLSAIRVVNASTVPSPLNVLVDGRMLLSNVPPTGVSDYQRVSVGSHTVAVEAASTPGATLLSTSVALAPATDTSIALTGSAGALQALVLGDNNLPPAAGIARVRFINVSAGVPAVDVYVNFARQLSSLTANAASGYVELAADSTGTSYQVDFNIAGTTTPALMLPNLTLVSGKIYSVYLVGSAGALQSVVAADR